MTNTIEKEKITTSIWISKELRKEVEKRAKLDRRSFNQYVICLLEDHINKK